MNQKTRKVIFNVLALLAVILAACGPAAEQSSVLAIAPDKFHPLMYPPTLENGIRDLNLVEGPNGQWYLASDLDHTRGDIVSIMQMPDGSLFWNKEEGAIRNPLNFRDTPDGDLIYQALSVEDMAVGLRLHLTYLGMDPNLVVVDSVERTIQVQVDFGPSINSYLDIYGNEARAKAAIEAAIELDMWLYDHGFAPLDNGTHNYAINLLSGDTARFDFEHGVLAVNGVYPDQYPVRNRAEYKQYLTEMLNEDLDVWLNAGSLPERPYDDPLGYVPADQSDALVAPDYPTRMRQIEFAEIFRGNKLYQCEVEGWLCFKDCDRAWGKTLVQVRGDGGIYWGKTYVDEVKADIAVRFWQTQHEMNNSPLVSAVTKELLGNGQWLVVSPDVGVPWYYYWTKRPFNPSEEAALIQQGKEVYRKLYQLGIACPYEIGCQQWTIDSNGRVWLVDTDGVEAAVNGVFSENVGTFEDYNKKVERAINAEYGGDHPMIATPGLIPPAGAAQDPLPSGSTTRVLVLSTVDDNVYPVDLTAPERTLLDAGGDEAIRMLATKSIPIPQQSPIVRGAKVVGIGLVYAIDIVGVAVGGYFIVDAYNESLGYGQEIQLTGNFNLPGNLSPSAVEDLKWLEANGFIDTPLFTAYTRDINTVYVHGNSVYPKCEQRVRLDSRAQVDLPGLIRDNDVRSPIIECASPDSAMLINTVTDERIIWKSVNGVWIHVEGPSCLNWVAPVDNNTGSVSVVAPFSTCFDAQGLITWRSTWMDSP